MKGKEILVGLSGIVNGLRLILEKENIRKSTFNGFLVGPDKFVKFH